MEHLQSSLAIEFGQVSMAGVKPENQDTIGARIPEGSALASKGIAIAIADGVSSSQAAKQASQTAITGFLTDYFATPDTWRTQQSATQVIQSLNRYLWSQSVNNPRQEGHLTTFSAVILKGDKAFIFHVGDSRIYRVRNGELELLTRDHCQKIDKKTTYLSRALGADSSLEIDLSTFELENNDYIILTTDGLHEFVDNEDIITVCGHENTLESSCQALCNTALKNGSQDNISLQVCKVVSRGAASQSDAVSVLSRLPFPPLLDEGQTLDGLTVIRSLQESERSQVYLVEDAHKKKSIMKTPSITYSDDLAYIERFVMESWVGTRIQNDRVVKVIRPPQERTCLFYLTEYLEGPTLTELIKQRVPMDILDAVSLIEEIAKGVRAFHRKDTLHQDIKPDNIIVTKNGPVIIDFGSAWVAGISEMSRSFEADNILGTLDYSAPEYRYGGRTSSRSDLFSVAALLYEMLTGKKPYGEAYAKAMNLPAFQKLKYQPASLHNPLIPFWLDKALEKALNIYPQQRYSSFSEWLQDIKRPNPTWQNSDLKPLLQRNPLRFWQSVAAVGWLLSLVLVVQLLG